MRVFLVTDDLAGNGPVWLNILWPMVRAFQDCFDLVHVPIPPRPAPTGSRLLDRLNDRRLMRQTAPKLQALVQDNLDPNGPNLLVTWAGSARILHMTRMLDPVWPKLTHRVAHFCDTVLPEHISDGAIERFDLITCFCADLLKLHQPRARNTLFWPAHVDTVNFHQRGDHRPIDLILVGRRHADLHAPLHRHFNSPDQSRIFLDFVTRTQGTTSCREEFELLMRTYGKSTAAFCYEPGNLARYQGGSPMLARWIHAWAAGCTVFGRAPTGTGTAPLLDWPDAAIDLPDDPQAAIHLIERVLDDTAATAQRRHRNLYEVVRRHDTRLRLDTLFTCLGLDKPQSLLQELERHAALVDDLRQDTVI